MTGKTAKMSKGSSAPLAYGPATQESANIPEGMPDVFKRTRRHARSGRRKDKDTRFRDAAFRRAVWQVLEHVGEEPIFGNFKKYDRLIDWEAFAHSINHPTRVALCHVLDNRGQKVVIEGTPVVVAREIEACGESEAEEILAKESKVFVKWW